MVLIEELAGHAVQARRMRSYGRHREALEASRQLSRVARTLGLSSPAAAPKPVGFGDADYEAQLAAVRARHPDTIERQPDEVEAAE
jgi:hypothetical protein